MDSLSFAGEVYVSLALMVAGTLCLGRYLKRRLCDSPEHVRERTCQSKLENERFMRRDCGRSVAGSNIRESCLNKLDNEDFGL